MLFIVCTRDIADVGGFAALVSQFTAMPETKAARERSVSGDIDVSLSAKHIHLYFSLPGLRAGIRCRRQPKPSKQAWSKEKPKVPSSSVLFTSTTALIAFVSSQAARRDQNRIAQREFRLRKQQRVCYPPIWLLSQSLTFNADS